MVFGDVTVLRPALLAIVVAVVSAVPVGRTEHAGAPEPARLTATAMDLALASTPTPLSPPQAPTGSSQSPRRPWTGGFQVHVLQVGQADAQLIIYPSGFTILIDAGEPSWNTCKGARLVADKVTKILGHNHIDVGTPSHWHVDHLGYAGYGGFWCLIENDILVFDKVLDRDGGVWRPATAELGSEIGGLAAEECDEDWIDWHNAGTVGGTAIRWVCYATDPRNTKIFDIREIAMHRSTEQIKPPDVGAKVTVVATDGLGATLVDGKTPVSGNHVNDALPPSENDYCIGLLIEFGDFSYVTSGDLDGEYATSSFGYTYNDVETPMGKLTGEVDVLHVNHHGSSHSSNKAFVAAIRPLVSVISCGFNNTHGHPAQSTLDTVLAASDVYLCNMCSPDRDYKDSIIGDGDLLISSTDGGRTFSIGKNSYISKPQPPAPPLSASPQPGPAAAGDTLDAVAATTVPGGLAPPSPPPPSRHVQGDRAEE